MTTLRVMTYNILLGGHRGAPLHDLVRTVAPDVLLVNESPKRPLLWRRDSERLARLWGMRYVTGGRTAGSNLILVRGGIMVLLLCVAGTLFLAELGTAWADPRLRERSGE